MTENNTSITSQEQYNEVRAQLENLIREATEKGMLESDADNEYTQKIGKLARLTAEYEENYMNILPLKVKAPLTTQVIIEQGTDGNYSAYITDENCEFGCIGEGKTIDETKADFMAAVEDIKAVYAEENKKFPCIEFEFCIENTDK